MKTRFAKLCGILLLFPLLLRAETIVVKTKAPHNKQAVFQYRIPKGYDKSRRAMCRAVFSVDAGKSRSGRHSRLRSLS